MDALVAILTKPDNIPILLMFPLFAAFTLFWWFEARRNDRLAERGDAEVMRVMEGPRPEEGPEEELRRSDPSTVPTWPYLVRIELLVALAVMIVLTVWSITIDAPLEELANPRLTPNPSKAPWYFLGLQEMLVYFDPWIAGVTLPLLIIGGLCAIPYLDINSEAVGYYSWRKRKFAISVFLFGFLGLWLPLIAIGVLCRGPGWQWFWPWVPWDVQVVTETPTVSWGELFGIRSENGATVFGALTLLVYYGSAVALWRWKRKSEVLIRLGLVRYAVVAFLLLTMLGLPIKMFLRLVFSVKYVLGTPWFNI
jgi:hypothetical protein